MNTKQVEELTGMSRQNIRYYERMGLLEPARDDSNAYRDYSEEDVRRLKLIRMLRMLDMPLKDIQDIINEKVSLREAVRHQKEILQTQQKQLNAAIEVCTSIGREKDDRPDVDGYLSRMETMEKNGGLFARFVDDYKQVVHEEQERKFSFYTESPVNTAAAFEKVLRKYAADHGQKFRMLKKGKYPEFVMGTETYTAVQILEKRKDDEKPSVKIVCEKKEPDQRNGQMPAKRRRALRGIHIVATNIRRYGRKSILNLLLSMLTVMILAFYLGNIAGTRRQLEEMPEKFTISGEIWNGCGEMNHGLFISHRVLDDLYESPLFGSIAESAELVGNIAMGDPDSGELDSEEKNGTDPGENDISLTGVNRTECLEGMKDEDIVWGDGVDWESFQKSSDTCLVSEIFAKESGLAIGDTVRFDLARYSQGLAGVTLTREELFWLL
ncbi:MerR family transcriptional regulator [Mediterraneibacter catenae]|uniref:MerR family transcriptional regulator n=1 Tax=Mediterraneibacter catenae TaxID=2594882 RepID=A0A5M9I3L5_9FIRM|nr:MerR family transcriptional regulator [Mediterraneibacter catenae]KAA8502065.1 MerR family transcriptional regulator [Mediterraneibacter catenae]